MIKRTSTKLTLLIVGVLLFISYLLGASAEKAELSISLSPEVLFFVGGFPVTNTFLWGFVLSVVLVVMAFFVKSRLREVPGRFQNLMEVVIGGGFDFVDTLMSDRKKTKRVFPLVFTMFLFILLANLFAFLPGAAAIKSNDVPLFRAVMSDYGFVLMMTMITIITAQIVAIVVNGPFGYLKKFINLSSPLDFFLGLMDLVGELAKILSLSFRLFGNIFAGEVLTMVMLFLAPYFIPLPFMLLGLLSAVIQAFVFALLTTIFISMASEIPEAEPGGKLERSSA